MKVKAVGFEAVQSIQNLANSVPLFAQRKTLIRVYTSLAGLKKSVTIKAEIELNNNRLHTKKISSSSVISVMRSGSRKLDIQRSHLGNSLNFVIPSRVLEQGQLRVRLSKVWDITDPAASIEIDTTDDSHVLDLAVHEPKTLRLHVLGIATNGSIRRAPQASDIDRIFHEVSELLPVSTLDFSHSVIDAPPEAIPPFSSAKSDGRDLVWERKHNIISACIMAKRVCDIETGQRDPRTVYYGMVADDGTLKDAAVSNVASRARPSIVSAGPGGRFAQVYAVHELGHVLTCLHPGHPPKDQARTDPSFPKSYNGRISDDVDKHMGWRAGAPQSQGRLLNYSDTFDLMAYATITGISAHNYLITANGLADIECTDIEKTTNGCIAVIGVFDKDNATLSGEIRYLYKSRYNIPRAEKHDNDVKVQVNRTGDVCDVYEIDQKFENGALHTRSGPFQICVPYTDDIESFTLVIKNKSVDSKPISALRSAKDGG